MLGATLLGRLALALGVRKEPAISRSPGHARSRTAAGSVAFGLFLDQRLNFGMRQEAPAGATKGARRTRQTARLTRLRRRNCGRLAAVNKHATCLAGRRMSFPYDPHQSVHCRIDALAWKRPMLVGSTRANAHAAARHVDFCFCAGLFGHACDYHLVAKSKQPSRPSQRGLARRWRHGVPLEPQRHLIASASGHALAMRWQRNASCIGAEFGRPVICLAAPAPLSRAASPRADVSS